MTITTVLKRKAKGFFKAEDVETITNAVYDVHDIITNASILIRAYYLDWFSHHDETSNLLQIDESLVHLATLVVQGHKNIQTRNRKDKELKVSNDEEEKDEILQIVKEKLEQKEKIKDQNKTHFNNLLRIHNDIFGSDHNVVSKYSLSHILTYSISNLVTAYENNIVSHFLKYPKKYIKCDLISKGLSSKEANKIATTICNFYYYVETTGFFQADDIMNSVVRKVDPDCNYKSLFPPLIEDP